MDWTSRTKLCLGKIESPAGVGLYVSLSVTVPEELSSVDLKWFFVLRPSIGHWLGSRYDFSVSVKLVEPHGLHFETNILVCNKRVRVDCKVQQHILVLWHVVWEKYSVSVNSCEKRIGGSSFWSSSASASSICATATGRYILENFPRKSANRFPSILKSS